MTRSLLLATTLFCLLAVTATAQSSYEDLLKQGQALWKERKPTQAMSALQKAIAVNPKGHEAHRELGRIFRFQRQPRQALKHLKQAVALAPRDGLNHFWLGVTYEKMPDFRALAITHLKKSIGLLPPTATVQKLNLRALAYNRIGGMQMKNKDHAAARQSYLRAHKISETLLTPLRNLAQMAHQAGRFNEARTWYEKLLILMPKNKGLQAKLAQIRKKQSVKRVEVQVLLGDLKTGETLSLDRLSFRGYDDNGRLVDFERHWEVSSGLVIEKTDPLLIRAKNKPSKAEYIYLTDKKTGIFGKTMLRISGKPVKLMMNPEQLTSYPEGGPVVRLESIDAASNRLAVEKIEWSLSQGEKKLSWPVKQLTKQSYRILIPKGTATGLYKLRARVGALTVIGQIKVVQRGSASAGISWGNDLEKGMALAKKTGKTLVLYLWSFD